ncbi:hypothetical protein [Robertmurraya sp.]|uniref:hypothetical protein n=1 Tax=Robertmurraya sp. TaxID=2837525 RepID=UPI003703A6DF
MVHFQWGTAIYQLVMLFIFIGIPFGIIILFFKRKSKIAELEKRIEQLEKRQKDE